MVLEAPTDQIVLETTGQGAWRGSGGFMGGGEGWNPEIKKFNIPKNKQMESN